MKCVYGEMSFRDPILTSTPNFMTAKKIKNESEIPHSERSEQSPFLNRQ
jgi:hypothetical protein